jgi:ribonuclease BN (tRNA processing enzyme)
VPVSLTVLGSGDAFNSEGRGNACYLLRDELGAVCVDFGPTALMHLKALAALEPGLDPDAIDAVFVTHLHGDHFGGLHLLLVDAEFSARRHKPLVICGPRGIEEHLARWYELAFGKVPACRDFDLRFVELDPGEARVVLGRRVTALPAAHTCPGQALCYRFDLPEAAVAFSGDTAWTDALIDLAKDTELFVCDCTEAPGTNPQHLTWEALEPKLDTLQTTHLLLSHLGPSMRRAADRIQCAAGRAGAPRVSIADDGLCLRCGAAAQPIP